MKNFQLDIAGVIAEVGHVNSGISTQGKQWLNISIVVRSFGEFTKDIEVLFFNDLVKDFTEGQEIKISAIVESRKFNDRHFTSVVGYKIL